MLKGLFEILKTVIALPRWRLYWFRHKRILDSITEMDQFREYVDKVQPPQFLYYYEEMSPLQRLVFQSVISALEINLKGIKFLDIGPAHGDSLDICYENGAESIEFVEIDPFFFTYNRLKGFTKGYRINCFTQLGKLEPKRYDLIWLKATFSVDHFIAINQLGIKALSLSSWLTQLERIASPTCQIIICPFWRNDGHKRNVQDVRHNFFTETMLNRGYAILPSIKILNEDIEYPLMYYKNMSRASHNTGGEESK